MRLAFLLLVAQVRESTAARCVAAALRWRLNVLHLHVHDVGIGLHHTVAHMQSGLEANLCFLDGNHCLLQNLQTERIPIVSEDVLDIYPRKVVFFPVTGKAMVKRLAHAHPDALAHESRGNAAQVAKTTAGGSVDLF